MGFPVVIIGGIYGEIFSPTEAAAASVAYVLSPIFQPYVVSTGIDTVLLGTMVCLQTAVGSATPSFGRDIFTAQLIFRRPYFEVIGNTPPFIIILLIVAVLLVMFPAVALFSPNSTFLG